ncbi:cadherin-like beta sandwich domain-containing protein [Geotalea uraniireducens]|uniref:Coagulation factor 5/8 type domain protein n=1 Tax=Geotalea uraniireducens (strain Rf4) TaxID=351605 RepID=A5GBS7_GEOUR|nr:cadherin-like beta sandwich domain-containing protein [Geotalea uraniireducens]ABQ24964.1 coagulation factor 5/8 type domain protein [Geotalea uraniireducens Rf4]
MGNIALNKTATASGYVAPFTPAKAVDGSATDPRNRWLCSTAPTPSGSVPPSWLCVDLGANYWVNRWVVKQMGLTGWSPSFNMVDYKFQGSLDDLTWFDIDSVTNNSANQTDRTCPARKARYVRVYVTKGLLTNTPFSSIAEFEVYEAPPTPNTLSALTITGNGAAVSTTPAFASTTTSYTASVTYDVASVVVSPTATDQNAVMKVNGNPVPRGGNATVPLNVGSNAVTVVVTPTIGDPQTYTITVTRASSQYLSGFTLKSGRNPVNYTPTFDKNTTQYTSTSSGLTSITITPTTEDPAAVINVGGTTVSSGQPVTLTVSGSTVIPITVTSNIGSVTKKYDLTVN